LYYNTLGKGDAALSRFIPLADGFGHGNTIRSTLQKPSKRIAVLPLAGLGEAPLHPHRTMHEHVGVQSPFRGAFLLPLKTP